MDRVETRRRLWAHCGRGFLVAKADKRDKNINAAVKKILKDFPPKGKTT